MKDHFISKHHS